MRRVIPSVVAAIALAATLVGLTGGAAAGAGPAAASAKHSSYADGRYIVTFVDDPVASYDGYVAGYPGHAAEAGQASRRATRRP